MSDRVVRLVDGHLVLVSEPTYFWLQAVMSGVLADAEVVETPNGPVFRKFGSEYRVGDRVGSGGGTIDAVGHRVPAGSGLTPDTLVDALQGDLPRRPPRGRGDCSIDWAQGHRGRST